MPIYVSHQTDAIGVAPASEQLALAREIIAAAEEADQSSPVSDQAMIAAAQGQRQLVLFSEQQESMSELSPPVAVGIVGAGELDLVVRPAARGRGVGGAALAQLVARAQGELRAWSHGENAPADALLARAGFTPVRTLYRMSVPPEQLTETVAALTGGSTGHYTEFPWPDGIHPTPIDPASPEQVAEWVRVNAAAFASHPEQGAVTVDDFAALTREDWFDPEDLILAYDADGGPDRPTGHLLGYTWVKTIRSQDGPSGATENVECELYVLGVRPDAAGMGLGRLLLATTMRRMASHAPTAVTLYVDGENGRAVELYERNGFTVAHQSRQWLRS